MFCERRALSKRLSGPSWEHVSAGSAVALLSLLSLQMKPKSFVPEYLHEENAVNSCLVDKSHKTYGHKKCAANPDTGVRIEAS